MEDVVEKKTINILHISAIKGWGGGENHIENLCLELQENNTVKNYIFCVHQGDLHRKLQKSSIPHFTAPLAFKADPRFSYRLGRICKKQDIDLVHIHDTTALTLTVLADQFHDLPPMVFSKKTSFPIRQRKQTLLKYNYPKIKKILCVSRETLRVTSEAIEEPSKLKVIYHGTRLAEKGGKAPFLLRERFQLKPETILIGNIANHIRAKQLEMLIEVADLVVNTENRKNIVFVQIGGFSSTTEELQKKIDEKDLQNHVKLLNSIPQASRFIPQFDISLITSRSEGLPQFLYESFYYEVPVVSTEVGGIPEAITNGENGFLSPIQDASTISRHILSLAEDKNLRKRFTTRSKQLLLDNFTTNLMAWKTLEEYKNIYNGKA